MNARASIVTALLGAAFVAGSGGARAQTATPSAAEVAFRDGRQAATAGDWASACPKFAESERLEPAPGTLLNLADCEAHIGKLMSAREHFDLAASAFPRTDKRHAIAADRAAALDKRLAHLTLRLATDAPPDAVVRSGATVVDHATLGQAAVADPGALTIVVSASGHVDRSYPLVLPEGGSVDQTVDVGPVAAPTSTGATTGITTTASSAAPAPTSDSAPRSHTQRTLGLVLGGVGAASLIVGGVTGILAIGKASTVKSHCDASDACDSQGVDAGNSGKVLAPVSTVTLIAGAALMAAGAYFYFFGDKSKTTQTQTAIVPVASPYGGGAVFLQSF